MHKHMSRLIVEDGSRGGWASKLRWSKSYPALKSFEDYLDEDYGPRQAGVSKNCKWRTGEGKEFGDRLSPLRRYLEAQVGRNWDDVYSEIRKVCDLRSLAGYHLMQHIKMEVEFNPNTVHYWRSGDLYVDEMGILQKEVRSLRWRNWFHPRKDEMVVDYVPFDDTFYYDKINGIWYHCERIERKNYFTGVIEHDVKKRQLNKKEIKNLEVNLIPKFGLNHAHVSRTSRLLPIHDFLGESNT